MKERKAEKRFMDLNSALQQYFLVFLSVIGWTNFSH